MSFEHDEEPTAAFTPNWDPLWDDESPWPPVPARAPERSQPEPLQSTPVTDSGPSALETVEPPEALVLPVFLDDVEPAGPVFRPPVPQRAPVGRTRRVLSRFRSAVVLAVVVVLSGVAMAVAFGVAVGVFGLVLKKTVGG